MARKPILTTPSPYPPELQAKVVARARQVGMRQAARELGVGRTAVRRWMERDGLPTALPGKWEHAIKAAQTQAAVVRTRVAAKFLATADTLLDKAQDAARGADARDYTIAASVALDKYRLEQGEATSRSESRDLTGDDHEDEALRKLHTRIREELASRRTGGRVDGPAEAGTDGPPLAADEAPVAGGSAG